MDPAINTTLQTANGWLTLPASLKRPDGAPRFNLHFPLYFLSDPGATHLIAHETNTGYEPPTRDLIERTLRRGDLFVDVGAHWGFFALQAATHPAGEIEVVAFEPELMNATILSENVARNNCANLAVVCAACGDQSKLVPLIANSTMRHCIHGADTRFDGRTPSKWVPVVALDGAIGDLPKQAERRIIIKIDAEGFEPNIIAGAKSLLKSGRVALIVWECGEAFAAGGRQDAMAHMVGFLSECGFRHLRPAADGADSPLIAFDAEATYNGNVFSYAPQLNEQQIFDGPPLAARDVRVAIAG
jgi:FkbM family methyltransferase